MARVSCDEKRLKVIDDLVTLKAPLHEVGSMLSKFPFDYDGVPYGLTAEAVLNAICLFESRSISGNDLHRWADLIEMRDDIEAESVDDTVRDWILTTIFTLATPELAGGDIESAVRSVKAGYQNIPR